MPETAEKKNLIEKVKSYIAEERLRRFGATVMGIAVLAGAAAPEVAAATDTPKHAEIAAKTPELSHAQIEKSRNSAVMVLVRSSGYEGPWINKCTATKFSNNRLIVPKHCLDDVLNIADTRPNHKLPFENYVGAEQGFKFAIGNEVGGHTNAILPVDGISMSQSNDEAMLSVNPHSEQLSKNGPHEWQKVASLDVEPAETPPALNSQVAITTFHHDFKTNKEVKVTTIGRWAGSDPEYETADGTLEPVGMVLIKRSSVLKHVSDKGNSGGRGLFANGETTGTLYSAANFKASPALLPYLKRNILDPKVDTAGYQDGGVLYLSQLNQKTLHQADEGLHHPVKLAPKG